MIIRALGSAGYQDPNVVSGTAPDAESLKVWGNRQIFPANVENTLNPQGVTAFDEITEAEILDLAMDTEEFEDEDI